jgi:hypothetical protein
MILYSTRHLENYRTRTVIHSNQDGTPEIAYRELLDLRERVRMAELAAAARRSSREQRRGIQSR